VPPLALQTGIEQNRYAIACQDWQQ